MSKGSQARRVCHQGESDSWQEVVSGFCFIHDLCMNIVRHYPLLEWIVMRNILLRGKIRLIPIEGKVCCGRMVLVLPFYSELKILEIANGNTSLLKSVSRYNVRRTD